MGWLNNIFHYFFPPPQPHKDCVEKALDCAKELKKRMPDVAVTTVTGPMLERDDPNQIRFEDGKLQFHYMAAIITDDGWDFYELHNGIPVQVEAPKYWQPTRNVEIA